MNKSLYYFSGIIKDAKLILRYKQNWTDFLHHHEGKEIELFANPKTKKRTGKQNDLQWAAVIQVIALHTGYEKDEVHAFFEEKFAERIPMTLGKKTEFIKKTCSTLSKNEFSDWIERMKQFAREELDMIFD